MENNFQENLEKEYEKYEKSIKKPNILLLGGTGVGKSSLTNLIFGTNMAQTGVGKPITQEINRYELGDIPVVIFDSVGYEIESHETQEKYISKIVDYVSASKDKPTEEQIHIVWYLIQSSGHRVTDWDLFIIEKIKDLKIPISVVFTKCDMVSEDDVNALIGKVKNVSAFQVTTSEKLKPLYLELDNLIQWSADNLEEGLKEAFVKAQKISVKAKRENANKIIIQHTAANATVGFSPIPFSDAPILLASQAAMVARILYVYDLQGYGDLTSTLLKSVSIGALISSSAKYIVGELIKFIPVIGSAAGGMITGAVAAALTAAIGYSVSEICFTICKLSIEGKEYELKDYLNNITPIFKDLMTQNSKI